MILAEMIGYIDLSEICRGNLSGLEGHEYPEALARLARITGDLAAKMPARGTPKRKQIPPAAPQSAPTIGDAAEALITVKQAAAMTGFASGTIRNWISSSRLTTEHGLIPGRTAGSRVRLRRDAFLAWVEAGLP